MNNSSLYIRCEALLIDENSEEVCIAADFGVYQIPRVGEYLRFGGELPPAPSTYIVEKVTHDILEHYPDCQWVVLYVKPVNKKELV